MSAGLRYRWHSTRNPERFALEFFVASIFLLSMTMAPRTPMFRRKDKRTNSDKIRQLPDWHWHWHWQILDTFRITDIAYRVLHPVHKSSRHQTTTKWKTKCPEFHEQFVYLTSIAELPKQSLHIKVWSKGGKGKKDVYIGMDNLLVLTCPNLSKLVLTCQDLSRTCPIWISFAGGIILGTCAKGGRLSHWTDLIKNPGQVHTKTHYLSANCID